MAELNGRRGRPMPGLWAAALSLAVMACAPPAPPAIDPTSTPTVIPTATATMGEAAGCRRADQYSHGRRHAHRFGTTGLRLRPQAHFDPDADAHADVRS